MQLEVSSHFRPPQRLVIEGTFAGGFLMGALCLFFFHTHADALKNLVKLFVEKKGREAFWVMAKLQRFQHGWFYS